jgi:molecular chaperone HscB
MQECRNCGSGAPADAHFCPQCAKILRLGAQADYFAYLGLPRRLNLDPADLEQKFRALSRQFHPDYFYNAPSEERRSSLERSSFLNDAYRALKQPATRIPYLLQLEGFAPSQGADPSRASKEVPPALLEEVFALNEELDEVRDLRASGASPEKLRARLQRASAPIEAKRAEHELQLAELSAKWDALIDAAAAGRPIGADDRKAVLGALRERMLERNYITNLLAGIERELAL